MSLAGFATPLPVRLIPPQQRDQATMLSTRIIASSYYFVNLRSNYNISLDIDRLVIGIIRTFMIRVNPF